MRGTTNIIKIGKENEMGKNLAKYYILALAGVVFFVLYISEYL